MEAPKYNIILADPPWQYKVFDAKGGQGMARNHYSTASLSELQALPVSDLAAKDCALFMWATPPCMPEALDVLRAWGFSYRTFAFTWVKRYKNGRWCVSLGHYTRGNAEVCLLGMRGALPRLAKNVPQVIATTRREHSRKPDETYGRIERLFGDLPRVELFARQRWPGWDIAFSNQSDLFPSQPFLFDEFSVA